MVQAVGVRSSDNDLLFYFHKYISLPIGMVKMLIYQIVYELTIRNSVMQIV